MYAGNVFSERLDANLETVIERLERRIEALEMVVTAHGIVTEEF